MDMVDMAIMDIMERERLRLKLLLLLSQDTTMAIMDIMERERLRLNQDITMDILITVDMDMAIMAREKLRQLLSPILVIIIMDIPIMEVMVTMDIMARGKLRQMLLLSPVITIMVMEAMIIMDMDMDIMARGRQGQ